MMVLQTTSPKKKKGYSPIFLLYVFIAFISGFLLCSTVMVHTHIANNHLGNDNIQHPINTSKNIEHTLSTETSISTFGNKGLSGLRVLVALASFDFGQFPLLEEVLDSYQDVCVAGAKIDLYIHTVIPYTVALIDLLNARISCESMTVTIAIQSPAVRLNLVDRHRELFYEKIEDYDLFIYSEDDIKVSPTTIKAYLQETKQVEKLVGKSPAEDYNVGIVRYEYNYPPDIVIDDKTRHATESVTRVYWEHLWKPLFPKSIDLVQQLEVQKQYVSMQNHHQGMFLATRDLLKAWKLRKGCEFDKVRQRPGRKDNPGQPTEGTQRVWMSSQMLHGSRHCNVQQLIPMKNFGQLTCWHLPNKNYRRVGKKGRIGGGSVENEFGTGKEKFNGPDKSLPTEMELHLEMRKLYPSKPSPKYSGIQMIDEVDRQRGLGRSFGMNQKAYFDILDQRLDAFTAYADRGGVMIDQDFQNWQFLIEKD